MINADQSYGNYGPTIEQPLPLFNIFIASFCLGLPAYLFLLVLLSALRSSLYLQVETFAFSPFFLSLSQISSFHFWPPLLSFWGHNVIKSFAAALLEDS